MASNKLTPHQRMQALEMWGNGASYAEVAAHFQVSKQTIWYWNKKPAGPSGTVFGLEPRPGRSAKVRCQHCRVWFRAAPSKKRKFCSRECATQHRRR
jgi:transposase